MASGLDTPRRPLPKRSFISSSVRATDTLGSFPLPCFLSCFCLDWSVFLNYARSLMMLTGLRTFF